MKKILFGALSAIVLFNTGCDSFLDQSPDERVEISNLGQVVQLIGSAYSTGNYGWLCEISSDNIVDINAPYLATQSNGSEVLVHYNLGSYGRMDDEAYKFEPVKSSTDSDSPTSIWEGCYNAIATVNHALVMLDEIKVKTYGKDASDDVLSDKIKAAYAECYLSRAYHHFRRN